MRIQHNIMAMNAYRNFSNNTSALSKNLEKLSSGYRINRAGDDAAGLAISEKMRAQITGLKRAQSNAKSGINLVQTAEGAMQEVHSMLNRMVDLANQSANGTYDEKTDRVQLQKEINQLKDEINRIADSANFNGIKLLDGSLASVDAAGGATAGKEIQDMMTNLTFNAAKGASAEVTLGEFADNAFDAFEITYTNDKGETKTLTLMEDKVAGQPVTTGGDMGAKDFVSAFTSGALKLSTTTGNAKADLEEFKALFDVTADPTTQNKLTISAKDATGGAKVTGFKQGSNASPDAAISGLADKKPTLKAAEGANATIQLTATTDPVQIGNKTYTAAAGAATAADAAKDLLAQLQKDGYTVELDKSDATGTTLKFTDMSQLQEAQKGVQITNPADDKFDVNAAPGTKGEVKFTFGAPTATEQTFTVNYINEEGKAVSKDIKYTPAGTNATDAETALLAALNGDSELKGLFTATGDSAGEVTITSKGSGTGSAYITGISTHGVDVASAVQVTAPTNTGKTLELNNGATLADGDKITIDGKTYQFMTDTGATADAGVVKVGLGNNLAEAMENLQSALAKNGVKADLYDDGTGVVGLRFDDAPTTETAATGGLRLQIGDTSDEYNQLTVSIKDMHANSLGLDGVDISTQDGAAKAVDMIRDAINMVSDVRGTLGATQNRLDHTINNLSVMEENIQDAESTIRDTDVAAEMMAYTKNNILIQSAQAMLAQANQVPQGVLQLLQ